MSIDSQRFTNVSATQGPFALVGGQYGMTVHAGTWGGGSASLQRLAIDGATYVTVQSFAADGFQALSLPPGTYQLAVSAASGVYADITSIITRAE